MREVRWNISETGVTTIVINKIYKIPFFKIVVLFIKRVKKGDRLLRSQYFQRYFPVPPVSSLTIDELLIELIAREFHGALNQFKAVPKFFSVVQTNGTAGQRAVIYL